ncbi:zinc-dependent alcohol dehydrogenase [Rossellomorea aquimaris]|uniref:Alcohol dehydrogenase n=1 Tax=Rossellomorea aquimaris TaxID=189382 RepID=A0A1J6W584_9BACI|nr:zinc-binding alcohol dehydrogenase [Rossellomorea aquimaris]OIU71780.1 alcohol dehydrogenase [Rossellomorea aquimaris]
MKQNSLMLLGKKELKWIQNELPPLANDEVLVKTIAGAISIGAEMPQYLETDITERQPAYPKETGYENYGEIIEVGKGVAMLKKGDRVVASFGHKDYGIIPEYKSIPVPRDIHYADALLTILSCDAAKGVLKLNPGKEDKVLVTGMGTMGLLTVYFLREYMDVRHIDVLEPNASRRFMAKQLGSNNLLNDISDCPKDFYDYGLECSGINAAFHCLQTSLLPDAGLCILSDGNKDVFELQPEFYEKELRIVGSSDGWDYQKHSQWYFENIKRRRSVLNQLFELTIGKEELIRCFEDLGEGRVNPLKVLVKY